MKDDLRKTKEQLIEELSQLQLVSVEYKILAERYKAIIEFANDAVFVADIETGVIVDANLKAQELTGYSREEIIGMHQRQLHPAEVLDEKGEFSKSYVRHVINTHAVEEEKVIHKDGTILDVSISAGVIELRTGKLIIGIFRDITEQKKIISELKRHQEDMKKLLTMLNTTNHIAKIGGWTLTPGTMKVTWTDEVYHIHELQVTQPPEFVKAMGYYPEDVRFLLVDKLQECLTTGKTINIELPLTTAKGNHLWVSINAIAERENGRIVRIIGSFQDITQRKQMEDLIRKNPAVIERHETEQDNGN
ncbi:MAG: PAS domain S-box protein [Nitrospirota bacterium]